MINRALAILVFQVLSLSAFAQSLPANISADLRNARNDSALVMAYRDAVSFYGEINRDSAISLINKALPICEKNHELGMTLHFKVRLAHQLVGREQYASAYSLLIDVGNMAGQVNKNNSKWIPNKYTLEQNKIILLGNVHYAFHVLMFQTSNWKEQKIHLDLAKYYYDKEKVSEDDTRIKIGSYERGRAFSFLGRNLLDSAFIVLTGLEQKSKADSLWKNSFTDMLFGFLYAEKHELKKSTSYLRKAIHSGKSRNVIARSALRLSQVYQQQNVIDSGFYYARMLVDTLSRMGAANYEVNLGIAYKNIYQCYLRMSRLDSAFKYSQLALKVNDSLSSLRVQNLAEFQRLSFSEQKRLEAIDAERKETIAKWIVYSSISVAVLIGVIAILQFKNSRQRQKTNQILIQQKQAVESTLSQLQATQSQLIQSEKMASLGELTAGIAHEIQNPLNFVNNFSEVSKELLNEMKEEADKGNLVEVKALANDVIDNQEKINFHGKRADAIVKGMLQHSRTSSGQKELTDINALCDEYLRLSYHGLRAKDKSFNAKFETDFDSTLPKINVIPQDIGRVILNLINNAFYAVNEKVKREAAGEKDESSHVSPLKFHYEPAVKVSTKNLGGKIEIRVQDNGTGIPDAIKEKIFQPFFTTKPTGHGTGLGLSLAYDIITKGHGSELKVESNVGEGSVFIIQLSVS